MSLVLLAALLSCQSARAATNTWTATSGGSWGTGGNWQTGAVPGSGDTVTFDTSPGVSVSNLTSTGVILFDTSAGSFTFTSGTDTSGGIKVGSSSASKVMVDVLPTVTTVSATETFQNSFFLQAGNTGFGNDAPSPGVTLSITGTVGSSNGSGTTILVLNGSNDGANTISGPIVDGASSPVELLMGDSGGGNGSGGGTSIANPNGNWIVSNTNNSFSAGVIVSSGTLNVPNIGNSGNDSPLGTNSQIIFGGNGSGNSGGTATLNYTGTGETSNKVLVLDGAGTFYGTLDQSGSGTLNFTSNLNDVGSSSHSFTFFLGGSTTGIGEISGNIPSLSGSENVILTKNGTGLWILSGANTYNGVTTINGGTLEFTQPNALYSGSTALWTKTNIVVASGATAAFGVGGSGFTSANIDTLKALSTGANGFENGSILGLDTTGAGGSFTYSSSIGNTNSGANSLGLSKLGTGTLVLSASSGYTGPTTVAAGTLLVSGSLSGTSTVSVMAGSILSVDGSVNIATTIADSGGSVQGQGTVGTLNIASSGTLAPGLSTANNNTGILTSSSGVTLESTSAFAIRLGVSNAGGTDHDELLVSTGSSVALGNSTIGITLGSYFANAPVDTFYNIIVGGYNSNSPTYFGNTAEVGGIGFITIGGYEFKVIYGSDGTTDGTALAGNDVSLEDIGAIPEPATWASLLAGTGLLLIYRRRRYRS